MTEENNKLRAIILSVLMVVSVFGGTLALAGTVAAAANDDVSSASVQPPADRTYDISGLADGDSVDASHTIQFTVDVASETEYNNVTIDLSESNAAGIIATGASGSGTSGDLEWEVASQSNGEVVVEVQDTTTDNGDEQATISVDLTLEATEDIAADTRIRHTLEDSFGNTATAAYKTYEPGSTVITSATSSDDVFIGETITVDAESSTNQKVQVFRLDEDDNRVNRVRNLDTTPGDVINFDTSGLSDGTTYEVVVGSGTGTSYGTFTAYDLGLTAEASDSSYTTEDAVTAEVDSNDPNGEYVAYLLDSNGDEVTNVSDSFDGSGSDTVNFGTQSDTGNYSVEVVHTDSGGTASTDTFEVTDAPTGEASFVTKAISEERGDVVTINVSLSGDATTADVQVGDSSVNYHEVVTVTDVNGDGYVEFYWNTYFAGTGSNTFSTADSSDDTAVRQSGTGSGDNKVFKAGRLSAGEYPVNVSTSDAGESDVATVALGSPTDVENSIQTWTAPDRKSSLDRTSANYVFNHISQDSSIAEGDVAVFEVTTAGIYGQLSSPPMATTSGQLDAVQGLSFTIAQTESDTGVNADPLTIKTSESLAILSGNTAFIYVDTSAYSNFSVTANDPSKEFDATLAYDDSAVYRDASSISTTFTVVRSTAAIDAPEEGRVTVEQSANGSVTGTSSLAAGTDLTVTARSSGGQNPFLRSATTTVQDDGTWEANIDVSDIPTGTNFTVSVKKGSQTLDTADATIGGAATLQLASLDAPETATPGETITVTATVENTGDSSGETEVAYQFDGETVETQNVSVDAGSTADVTFEYTVPSETGDYTHGVMVGDNAAVTAGITVQEETTTTEPTTTEPTTEEPTTEEPTTAAPTTSEEPDETTADDSGGQPGFGVAVALVALLAAALLATRRDN